MCIPSGKIEQGRRSYSLLRSTADKLHTCWEQTIESDDIALMMMWCRRQNETSERSVDRQTDRQTVRHWIRYCSSYQAFVLLTYSLVCWFTSRQGVGISDDVADDGEIIMLMMMIIMMVVDFKLVVSDAILLHRPALHSLCLLPPVVIMVVLYQKLYIF